MKSSKQSRRARSSSFFGLQSLESRQLLSAVVTQSVPSQTLSIATANTLNLATYFADNSIAAGNTVVDLKSSSGSIPVELTNAATPATVANFLKYVNGSFPAINKASYANTIIHRDVPGFVIQGGGYTTDGAHIPTPATVPGESSTATLKNTTGTLSMALSTGPNSGTSEFFVNLTNNPFLDDASDGGPFTAFGKVIYNGLSVINSIAGLGQVNASAQNGAFGTLPVNGNYTGPTSNTTPGQIPAATPIPVPPADLVTINPVVLANSGLKFSVVSSNPALVSASIVNGVLTLNPAPGATTGSANVTVTATDLGGGTVNTIIPVVYTAVITTNTLTPTGITFQAVVGQAYVATVGGFTSSDTTAKATDFTAVIDYGDTGGAAGMVVSIGPGTFTVIGGHGYSTAAMDQVTVKITGPNSTSTTIHSIANVTGGQITGATLTPTPITFNPVVNQAYAATVGGFTSSDTNAKASDFTAQIDYGDTGGAAGTVISTAPGVFSVIGGHGYSSVGSVPVTVTVSGPGGSSTIIRSTAAVQAGVGGTTTLTPIGLTFHPQAGKAYAATVGSFSSSDLTLKAGDFTAFIDYGDTGGFGGNIFQTSPGVFTVIGGHGYAVGNFAVTVTITGPGGIKTKILSIAAVT